MTNSDPQPTLTYAILDAARIFGELETAQKLETNFLSLYMGQSEDLLSSVAPYLFPCQSKSEFGTWLFQKGWGNSWGVFVSTPVSIDEIQQHFRKFLMVQTEDGTELYFRFYDPRVLRIFLPTCELKQLHEFFGPVKYYSMEDEDPDFALLFSFDGEKLITEKMSKKDFVEFLDSGEVMPGLVKEPVEVNIKKEEGSGESPFKGWNFLLD